MTKSALSASAADNMPSAHDTVTLSLQGNSLPNAPDLTTTFVLPTSIEAVIEQLRSTDADGSAIPELRKLLQNGNELLFSSFDSGLDVRALVAARSVLVDSALQTVWKTLPPAVGAQLCLIAVGGYGRGELFPYSDVDLLILLPERGTTDLEESLLEQSLSQLIASFWDMGLDIGHSVRTPDECIEQASADITIATNLLETRLLAGSTDLYSGLVIRAFSDESWTSRDFYIAKRSEQAQRHEKYEDTEYNLEPNLKTSPGGLRDVQTIGWISKRYYGGIGGSSHARGENEPPRDMVVDNEIHEGEMPDNVAGTMQDSADIGHYSFLNSGEFRALKEAENVLWWLRFGLHRICRRSENRLLFDHQRTLALMTQDSDTVAVEAVEAMMREFYLHSQSIQVLNDVMLQHFDEVHRNFHDTGSENIKALNRRFQVRNHYIEAVSPDIFQQQPFALIEVFLLLAQYENVLGISADTIRAIRENLHLITERFSRDLINTSLFMEILKTPHELYKTLGAMKRYGVLGRYLPAFGRIEGQMQHDLFHVYTVDVHTLHFIENIDSLFQDSGKTRFPNAHDLAAKLPKRELLYIAGLFHDIAKGRGGDHSELGAEEVREFARRHQLSQRDTSLLAWLVENHLMMSTTAQRRDISDPVVIHEFAQRFDSNIHLDYLYTMTVCDIAATSPNLWNSWRAVLLQNLYTETRAALARGKGKAINREDWIASTRSEVLEILLEDEEFTEQQLTALWNRLDDEYFQQDSTRDIASQTATILRHGDSTRPLVSIEQARGGTAAGYLEVLVYMEDKEKLFAGIVSTFDKLDLGVLEARIFQGEGNLSLSLFIVSETDSRDMLIPRQHILKNLMEVLDAIQNNRPFPPPRQNRRTSRQLQYFSFPTEVVLSNNADTMRTILSVVTPDRSGVLARIASVFVTMNVQILRARIATLGERVEDSFEICEPDDSPLSNPERCNELQEMLCEVLDRANENAA
ncbi:[protein-PII] uridylyltransferase [Allohahella marinimesophila]|uniref:Bifunctional uridylyltransferase/uridylyl-removing enzyme n=1 Tax=Allohahella marinimesophila TaxID=1054972 RepID=A0ABP7PQT4_9GAMM